MSRKLNDHWYRGYPILPLQGYWGTNRWYIPQAYEAELGVRIVYGECDCPRFRTLAAARDWIDTRADQHARLGR
jgi:hypothetical protein